MAQRKEIKLDIVALVRDVGGARVAASIAGQHRTAPYGWMRRGCMPSRTLEVLFTARPGLHPSRYFVWADPEARV